MATRGSSSKQPKKASVRKPASTKATKEGMTDSIAVYIGKSLGKAVKQTRAVRDSLSTVGAEVVDAGSRAAKTIKEYLPDAIAGRPAKPRRKKVSSPAGTRKSKTAAVKRAR